MKQKDGENFVNEKLKGDPILAKNVFSHREKFYTIYKLFCRKCLHLCQTDSTRPMTEYCSRCQKMIHKVFNDK